MFIITKLSLTWLYTILKHPKTAQTTIRRQCEHLHTNTFALYLTIFRNYQNRISRATSERPSDLRTTKNIYKQLKSQKYENFPTWRHKPAIWRLYESFCVNNWRFSVQIFQFDVNNSLFDVIIIDRVSICFNLTQNWWFRIIITDSTSIFCYSTSL